MKYLIESFDLQKISTPRISPKTTRKIIIKSFEDNNFSNQDIHYFLTNNLKNLKYSYKFNEKGKTFLLYEIFTDSVLEYHFFDIDDPKNSAQDVGDLDNSLLVFSRIFNILYTELKEDNWKYPVKIVANTKRLKLYEKIFNKVNKKYSLGLTIKDKNKEFFIIDIPRAKSFREMIK